MPKFNILDHNPAHEETELCERCHTEGAASFSNGERLCLDCAKDDVFEQWNERED